MERIYFNPKPELTDKASFIAQYILNRASIHPGGLEASAAAKEAERAWENFVLPFVQHGP